MPTKKTTQSRGNNASAVISIEERQRRVKEITKCIIDPVYFLKNYVHIQDKKTRQKIKFNLYPAQEDAVRVFLKYKKVICLKSRQSGFSWLFDGITAWATLFQPNFESLLLSIDDKGARRNLRRIKFMLDNLPDWMFNSDILKESNQHAIELFFDKKTTSRIESLTTSPNSGRGESPQLIFWDEMGARNKSLGADGMDEIWDSIQPALESGFCALVSTPKGTSGIFYEEWQRAIDKKPNEVEGANGFVPVVFHWSYDPSRVTDPVVFAQVEERRKQGLPPHKPDDEFYREHLAKQPWYVAERKKFRTQAKWNQEYELIFNGTGSEIYDAQDIAKQEQYIMPDSLIVLEDQEVEIYKQVEDGCQYICAVDIAEGRNGDDLVATIYKVSLQGFEQVVQLAVNDWKIERAARKVVELCRRYNGAFLIWERNNNGELFRYIVVDEQGYYNIYYDHKGFAGFQTNAQNKPVMVADLSDALHDESIIIRSKKALEQIKIFKQLDDGTLGAPSGKHDDCVMATCLALIGGKFMGFGNKGVKITVATSSNTF